MSKEQVFFGFCPKCGSDQLVYCGFTTNHPPKPRYKCKPYGHRTTTPRATPPTGPVPMRSKLPHAKIYLITAAQNATPVHEGFWSSFEYCAQFYGAEKVVLPGRYKNPTSRNEDRKTTTTSGGTKP